MFQKILPLFITCFFAYSATAQEGLGLQLFPGVLQNTKTNPALVPDEQLVISLPGIYGNYYHTVGGVGDLLNVNSDSTATLNAATLLNNLKENNTLRVNQEFETFHINYRISDKVSISLHHAAKSNNYLYYPETLPKLFLQGNAQYIDEDVSFGPDQHTFAYNEIGIGTAVSFGKLTLGTKVKLLLGIGDISTSSTNASLYTDPDIYQLTLNSDYRINTATFSEVLLFDTLSGYNVEYGFREMVQFENFQTENVGYAFDFGLSYEVNDRLSIGASVLDLGKINWRNSIVNYNSSGAFTFEGLDLKGALTGDSISLSSAIDTVQSIFAFETTIDEYDTKLPTRFNVNANYQVNDKLLVAATFNHESYRGRSFNAFGIGGHYTLNKNLSFGLTYGIRNNTYFNIGLNVVARKGPVQLFLTTDNVASLVQPYKSNSVNARVGLNLIFDELKGKEEVKGIQEL